MIIGDAAGFISPISREGIHPSVVSGQMLLKSQLPLWKVMTYVIPSVRSNIVLFAVHGAVALISLGN